MNVLSLFDGISCGQLALQNARIPYNSYFASEIHKPAIQLTQYHFPNTIQLGNVKTLTTASLPKINIFLAGFPCQAWSLGGKKQGTDDPRGSLFWDMVRLLKETSPKYFLIENVRMKQEHEDFVSEHIGVKPVMLNSSLFSAQNRVRNYWTNIPFDLTKLMDKNLDINDIMEDNGYWIGAALRRRYKNGESKTSSNLELRKDRKANALLTIANKSIAYNKNTDSHRMFTKRELERLQTVPEGYTDILTYSQAQKALANGRTVDVVSWLLEGIKNDN